VSWSKPKWSIRAHTQPENHRCLMTWSYDGFDSRIRTYNRDAHEIIALVKWAYEQGRKDGAVTVRSAVFEALDTQ